MNQDLICASQRNWLWLYKRIHIAPEEEIKIPKLDTIKIDLK